MEASPLQHCHANGFTKASKMAWTASSCNLDQNCCFDSALDSRKQDMELYRASNISADSLAPSRKCSCSLPSTPRPAKPVPAQMLRGADASATSTESSATAAYACLGWFFKCRGCGCMTAYGQTIKGAEVPFCRRCQCLLAGASPKMKQKMAATLLYVHEAWTNAGL